MKEYNYEVKSYIPNIFETIFVHFYMSIFTSSFAFIILYLFDGENWYLIKNDNLLSNLLFLLFLGLIISYLYLRSEFKRYKSGTIYFSEKEFKLKKDDQDIRIYPKKMFIDIKIDKFVFRLINKYRLTILIQPLNGKRLQYETLLLDKEKALELVNFLNQYKK